MAAALFLTRTQNIYLGADCALGPLWNPLRLAEDIAFVDAMTGGRLLTALGLVYRPAPIDEAWNSVELLTDKVIPGLGAEATGSTYHVLV